MQKRAGILFISQKSSRIFLILEDSKWTVPTFARNQSVFEDSKDLIGRIYKNDYRLIPLELYISQDKGFEYSTYICLVDEEFLTDEVDTFCWTRINSLPRNIHNGLKSTLSSQIIQTKIDTILSLEKLK